ncbi:T9SS type A sorting domain-containing protein [Flavobacterium frigidimaris]|uniref:T9SS type A sorting domain-containing protein n=1 Tax=Flavobacterium frigidimaris TaxID=262320 RepID=UPI0009F21B42
MESVSIYDVLGQLVIAIPNTDNISKIDVSKLHVGNYILKLKTQKGFSAEKFIKK